MILQLASMTVGSWTSVRRKTFTLNSNLEQLEAQTCQNLLALLGTSERFAPSMSFLFEM